jgi:hypothetical protein
MYTLGFMMPDCNQVRVAPASTEIKVDAAPLALLRKLEPPAQKIHDVALCE